MTRLVVLFTFGLLATAQAEVLSTPRICDVPVDLPAAPGLSAEPVEHLNTVQLPRITIDVKREFPLAGRSFAEALLARVTVEPSAGSVTYDERGKLFASSPRTCAD